MQKISAGKFHGVPLKCRRHAGLRADAPSANEDIKVTQFASVPGRERDVSSWHEADIKQRPLFGRYGLESGHHRLIVSISAFDPSET